MAVKEKDVYEKAINKIAKDWIKAYIKINIKSFYKNILIWSKQKPRPWIMDWINKNIK